jgi:5-methyltetrahydrofolate--homocysteine methyltransferase
MLFAAGLGVGECPETWNLSHPDVVRGIAARYVEAGAQVVSTNSFGASRLMLGRHGHAQDTVALNEAAASLSREAVGDGHVCASMGPSGKFLMMGDTTEDELYTTFKEQAMALERGGADACCIETMADLDEARIAVRAAKENTDLEIVCSFTFNAAGGAYHTMMGVTPEQMVEVLLEAGADILGCNCTLGPAEMLGLVGALHAAAPGTPILVHPNAGQPLHGEEGITYPETPESFARYVPDLVAAGAKIIGGCCGTTPEHIRAIAAALA